MTLLQRVGYYLGGFSMGLIILAFFLNGKHVSCSYGPEARVLKDISTKKVVYNEAVTEAISNQTIDSITIAQILANGSISFSDSQARKKPCGIYAIEGTNDQKNIVLSVENCDSIATVLKITMK
ncbi:hypothetical protein [Yeosuana marina]|uniref:hypothetical protein n=1 Tax=Yeosuana marina TaxID=1565536 RepID=UPI0030C8CAD9